VVAPFLLQQGYRRIDRLVISHSDNDHIGGGKSLSEQFNVSRVESGEPGEIDWARSRHCSAGQEWSWDQVAFEYLAPLQEQRGNNASCVLRVETAAGRVLLLPGDIERGVEQKLLQSRRQQLAADIVVAPHHGSRTSSTPAFVQAVNPVYALFPVGYRNRFGFPRPEVLDRYRAVGARIFNTADSGAIQIRLGVDGRMAVDEHRLRERRYWHSKP
jgi:competence protein ComEC